MDPEKSSNSSFEDLSNLNEGEREIKDEVSETNLNAKSEESIEVVNDEILDVIGNGQLTKKTVKKAETDVQPQRGDIVTINYTGKLEDGTIVEHEENLKLHVGDFEVVQGLDMVIPLMRVGEICEVFTDQRFAYGTIGLTTDSKFAKAPVPPHASVSIISLSFLHDGIFHFTFTFNQTMSLRYHWKLISTLILRRDIYYTPRVQIP